MPEAQGQGTSWEIRFEIAIQEPCHGRCRERTASCLALASDLAVHLGIGDLFWEFAKNISRETLIAVLIKL